MLNFCRKIAHKILLNNLDDHFESIQVKVCTRDCEHMFRGSISRPSVHRKLMKGNQEFATPT